MEILPQIIVFALIASAIYALISAGLTLTFGTLEFINFAHGEMAMAGAYTFLWMYITMGIPLILSAILTVIAIALLGLVIERFTFRPVRDKPDYIPLVLSIGISIILQSIATLFYGGGSQTYAKAGSLPTVYTLMDGSVTITQVQVIIIVSAVVLLTVTHLFLKHSKTGKAMRAVADSKEVAAIMGINVNRTIAILFAIGAGLAAIGGILVAFDQNMTPLMGLMMSIKAFAAIVLGGVGKFHGAIAGAIIIGFIENLSIGLTSINGSHKGTIVFIIFILVLLIKPYGIFGGKKEEIESR